MPGMLDNLGSSAKGMFFDGAGPKAIIYIPNPWIYDPDEIKKEDEETINGAAQAFENKLIDALKKGDVSEAAEEKLGKGAKLLKGLKSLGPGGSSASKVGEVSPEDKNFFKITVQFNPSSIKMDSVNGKIKDMNQTSGNKAKILNEQEYHGKTTLAFDLIFDDVNLMDAFMLQEVFDMNVSKGISKGVDMYTHKGNTFSVRARMEIFLALLATTATQHVIFTWGKMVFRGQVTSVSNHYTMFNTRGNPIRGTMHLEITQDAKKNDKFEYQNLQWSDAFKQVFKDGKGGGTSVASKLLNNNILNI